MLRSTAIFFIASGLSVLGASAATTPAKLLIGGGGSGSIFSADFNGTSFTITGKNTISDTDPSWLRFREGTNQLYAVDEYSSDVRLFNYTASTNKFTLIQKIAGSSGDVFLEFNNDRTRMLGAAYDGGAVDVWDVSSPAGKLVLKKKIPSTDALGPGQDGPHPHQVNKDPSGRFFVFNDLGTDTISVIDSLNDAFTITGSVKTASGCGPRHGVFYPQGASQATHYIVVCELLSKFTVFKVSYASNTLQLTSTQTLSTFGSSFPPADPSTAAAGEIQLSADSKNVYVSNRVTGNATDSLAHFTTNVDANGALTLQFKDTVSSGGLVPRMFSLGIDSYSNYLFSTNQDGKLGLVAYKINTDGSFNPTPVASLPLSTLGTSGNGPQFVQQVRV